MRGSRLRRSCAAIVACGFFLLASSSAVAQTMDADAQPSSHAAAHVSEEPQPPHDMQHMDHDHAMSMQPARDGSGTSWLPDDTPMYAVHREAAGWMLMAHGSAFLQYLDDTGERGNAQAGSINWLMGMADRSAGGGHLGLRGMMSLEPWTIRGCGYPDLLASGERCDGAAIHDRQHPHDLFMELAATYDHPLAGGLRWQLYGGPVGEP
ncbi:MAG TPA: hypothetical protein VNG89_23860, partial [Vicinamibacterales bacterium]|nr:hypothetical protein [Vicinamibacterales bacterium]